MQIAILDTPIRQTPDGLFCLNDLHKAAGGLKRHQPSNWLRNQQAKDLIAELSDRSSDMRSANNQVLSVPNGDEGGTFVAWPLVYSYAMWVSPKFHLRVIETFHRVQMEERAALARDATSYQAIARSSDDLLISDAAIILKVKQKEFFTFLSKGLGWIYKRGNVWRPKQKAVEDGYVARRCSKYFKDGEEKRSYQTVITEMGMAFAQQRRLAA